VCLNVYCDRTLIIYQGVTRMKKILLLVSLLYALNGFSQSYVVLSNGVTLTVDKAGFVYDFSHFILPFKVSHNGGQFLVEDDKFITIDESGFLYRKEEKAPSKIRGKGINYIVSENGIMHTVDSAGFLYKYDKDVALRKAIKFGGRFFITENKGVMDLYTTNKAGNYFKMKIEGLNVADIQFLGGNYFITNTGALYTITSEGYVYPQLFTQVGRPVKLGGTYLINSDGNIFTIAENGDVALPPLPLTLDLSLVTKLGLNYFIDSNGAVFTVDSMGLINQRSNLLHDMERSQILSH
jgi:hypothetical protein